MLEASVVTLTSLLHTVCIQLDVWAGNEHLVLAHVCMHQWCAVQKHGNRKAWQEGQDKLGGRHIGARCMGLRMCASCSWPVMGCPLRGQVEYGMGCKLKFPYPDSVAHHTGPGEVSFLRCNDRTWAASADKIRTHWSLQFRSLGVTGLQVHTTRRMLCLATASPAHSMAYSGRRLRLLLRALVGADILQRRGGSGGTCRPPSPSVTPAATSASRGMPAACCTCMAPAAGWLAQVSSHILLLWALLLCKHLFPSPFSPPRPQRFRALV